ncbi:hypothetical protein BJF79_35090 [Actinomadura sp. CNU-125]|uniref:hypothetical protein n=1 Tax=Actinomadura sp. CNU-125 TaxID=1904961 RepID=UPI000960C231|nr:hypothetical protein [Actinomadura sp. CNU-125]OLT33301.1 hypothetical protein BJF79_35090 [Actinomadura sp. CNU-125]
MADAAGDDDTAGRAGARILRAAAGAALALFAARAAYTALTARPPGLNGTPGEQVWGRTNHRGEPVTLLEGPAFAAGAVAGGLLAPGFGAGPGGRSAGAALLAGAGSGVLGGYDDLTGSGASRGFKGHLGGPRARRGHQRRREDPRDRRDRAGRRRDRRVPGAVPRRTRGRHAAQRRPRRGERQPDEPVRPASRPRRQGRADRRDAAGAGVARGRRVGAAAALLPEDLGERAMLGDTGANALRRADRAGRDPPRPRTSPSSPPSPG